MYADDNAEGRSVARRRCYVVVDNRRNEVAESAQLLCGAVRSVCVCCDWKLPWWCSKIISSILRCLCMQCRFSMSIEGASRSRLPYRNIITKQPHHTNDCTAVRWTRLAIYIDDIQKREEFATRCRWRLECIFTLQCSSMGASDKCIWGAILTIVAPAIVTLCSTIVDSELWSLFCVEWWQHNIYLYLLYECMQWGGWLVACKSNKDYTTVIGKDFLERPRWGSLTQTQTNTHTDTHTFTTAIYTALSMRMRSFAQIRSNCA